MSTNCWRASSSDFTLGSSACTRKVAAAARLGSQPDDDYDERLNALLPSVEGLEKRLKTYVLVRAPA